MVSGSSSWYIGTCPVLWESQPDKFKLQTSSWKSRHSPEDWGSQHTCTKLLFCSFSPGWLHYSTSMIGTPLQYSCLENPMDRGAWWVASTGLLRVGHDWVTSLSLFMHWRRKWQPTPVFLPGEPQGRGSLVGCRLWGHTELDTTGAT